MKLFMPGEEFLLEVGEGDAHLFVQDEEVVEKVGGLVDVAVKVAGSRFEDGFDRLFTHFLGNLFHPFVEKVRGVVAFGHFGVTALDHLFQGAKEAFLGRRVEAGDRAPVAGRTVGTGLDEDRVRVTIHVCFHDMEIVPAGLSLDPQLFPAAAPESDKTGRAGLLPGFGVHVSQHQDLAGRGVLDDGRYEAVGVFCKIKRCHIAVGCGRGCPGRQGRP